MSVSETLITGGVGLVSGLVLAVVPLRIKNRMDREAHAEETEQRHLDEAHQALERQRAEMDAQRVRYLDLLGSTMVLLEAVLPDADNADQLLSDATHATSTLQGHAHGPFFVRFEHSPPVIWCDRACRTLLGEALHLANDARADRLTGEAARAAQAVVREIMVTDADGAGPRELLRWTSDQAIQRWPQPLATFEQDRLIELAQRVAERARLDLPPALLPPGASPG